MTEQIRRREDATHGVSVASRRGIQGASMNFSTAVDRVRSDFEEMPALELTIGEAVRLWNFGADDCRFVLDALVDAGFLRWSAKRTVLRATPAGHAEHSHISVRRSPTSDERV